MDSSRDSDKFDQEIKQSLNIIVDEAEKSAVSLRKRERNARIVRSLILGFIECAALIGIIVALLIFSNQLDSLRSSLGILFASVGPLSWIAGSVISYFVLARRKNSHLEELSNIVGQLKSRKTEATTEGALSMTDKIITILPELERRRTEDSLLYGILAFIVSLVISRFAPLALIVGVAVWLFFRYELRRTYERTVAKFEEQKLVFEQRKKDFMESL
ncbi:MAG: hypothetical protein JRN52_02320 [Nitrososphaerota archaeon]|nr:hypothetical protein [Nitrososphaerota archaeon]